MRKIYFALFLISGIIITSCANKTDSLQFEKDVMYEVYPDLIDSVWVNALQVFVPPPPPQVKDTLEYIIRRKKEYKKQFNEELAESKKKHFKLDLVILDKAISKQKGKELQEHFKNAVVAENAILDTLDYKLDRKKLDSYKAFHLHYVSKIPRENDRKFYNECCYSIRGLIILSRIQFDDEKKYGVLTAGIECGGMCGYGYRIFIRKVNNKWVVDKIEEAWIA
jgi:hypothetical protein